MKRPAQILGNYLKENKLTIAFAESITCGLSTHLLGNISNASEFLKGGIICYNENVKINLLKVKPGLIKKFTAESQEVTDTLAKNLHFLFDADIYAAITGLAAPGGSESPSKPVGTVFYAVYFRRKCYRLKKQFKGSPLVIKKKSSDEFYKFIIKTLTQEPVRKK